MRQAISDLYRLRRGDRVACGAAALNVSIADFIISIRASWRVTATMPAPPDALASRYHKVSSPRDQPGMVKRSIMARRYEIPTSAITHDGHDGARCLVFMAGGLSASQVAYAKNASIVEYQMSNHHQRSSRHRHFPTSPAGTLAKMLIITEHSRSLHQYHHASRMGGEHTRRGASFSAYYLQQSYIYRTSPRVALPTAHFPSATPIFRSALYLHRSCATCKWRGHFNAPINIISSVIAA